ncbi:hypothetical protein B0H63DRAFT_242120 [Podospora didyma]|uniref:Uncharacterized protein n=1 Tax=Podospora didyma TaxID=330526 RepID=A0AAE0NCE3_9PEZI|nr:hypothetical protein B0H63DRAFT_242120 [Podospora didyma]
MLVRRCSQKYQIHLTVVVVRYANAHKRPDATILSQGHPSYICTIRSRKRLFFISDAENVLWICFPALGSRRPGKQAKRASPCGADPATREETDQQQLVKSPSSFFSVSIMLQAEQRAPSRAGCMRGCSDSDSCSKRRWSGRVMWIDHQFDRSKSSVRKTARRPPSASWYAGAWCASRSPGHSAAAARRKIPSTSLGMRTTCCMVVWFGLVWFGGLFSK